MSIQVGDTVRLHDEGESHVLDGMLGIVGATELFGSEVTVSRIADDGEFAVAYAAPLAGYEYLGEFPLDSWTSPDFNTEEVAA